MAVVDRAPRCGLPLQLGELQRAMFRHEDVVHHDVDRVTQYAEHFAYCLVGRRPGVLHCHVNGSLELLRLFYCAVNSTNHGRKPLCKI